MSNKNKHKSGIVYSTNPEAVQQEYDETSSADILPQHQVLRIFLDRKAGGKYVSRIHGYAGSETSLQLLAAELKKLCGVGGSVKEGEIWIQGDHRDKLLAYLHKQGFSQTKKAGG